jgi:hypothetical protein
MNANAETLDATVHYCHIITASQVKSIAGAIPLKPIAIAIYGYIVFLHEDETGHIGCKRI